MKRPFRAPIGHSMAGRGPGISRLMAVALGAACWMAGGGAWAQAPTDPQPAPPEAEPDAKKGPAQQAAPAEESEAPAPALPRAAPPPRTPRATTSPAEGASKAPAADAGQAGGPGLAGTAPAPAQAYPPPPPQPVPWPYGEEGVQSGDGMYGRDRDLLVRPFSFTAAVGPGGFFGPGEEAFAVSYTLFRLGFGLAPGLSFVFGYEGIGTGSENPATGLDSWLQQNIWSLGIQGHVLQHLYVRGAVGIGTVEEETDISGRSVSALEATGWPSATKSSITSPRMTCWRSVRSRRSGVMHLIVERRDAASAAQTGALTVSRACSASSSTVTPPPSRRPRRVRRIPLPRRSSSPSASIRSSAAAS